MSFDSAEIAISVKNLTKNYRIFDSPGQSFLYHVFKTKQGRDFTALNDVSFEVHKGESFGIIGRNGSGKSTLLQILAGILKESSGSVEVNGKVAALLELGSGFDPESTGYENIYMNAAILGVSKESIDKKIQEIIDFADIGDFIGQPVKTYSSGMFVRLAFAVAINVDAEVLLIDEALAVGDVFFRQKCYDKLNELKEKGITIILVSHGMNEVEQFCDRALLLSKGKPIEIGDSRDVVKHYYVLDLAGDGALPEQDMSEGISHKLSSGSMKDKFGDWKIKDNIFFDISGVEQVGDSSNSLVRIGMFDEKGEARRVFYQGEYAYLYAEVLYNEPCRVPLGGFVLYNSRSVIVHGKDSLQVIDDYPDEIEAGTKVAYIYKVRLDLGIDDYTIDFGTADINKKDFDNRGMFIQEEINAKMKRGVSVSKAGSFSVHANLTGKPMKMMFHGIAGLEGDLAYQILE